MPRVSLASAHAAGLGAIIIGIPDFVCLPGPDRRCAIVNCLPVAKLVPAAREGMIGNTRFGTLP